MKQVFFLIDYIFKRIIYCKIVSYWHVWPLVERKIVQRTVNPIRRHCSTGKTIRHVLKEVLNLNLNARI